MSRRIELMRNLGPRTATWLREAGIADEAALRELGAVAAYRRLKHEHPREVSLNALWGLAAALLDMDWRELPPELKAQLREEAGR